MKREIKREMKRDMKRDIKRDMKRDMKTFVLGNSNQGPCCLVQGRSDRISLKVSSLLNYYVEQLYSVLLRISIKHLAAWYKGEVGEILISLCPCTTSENPCGCLYNGCPYSGCLCGGALEPLQAVVL